MTIETALQQGRKLFEDAAVPASKLTAEVLLCHALGKDKSFLYAHPEYELREVEWLHYGRYLHERLDGKPTQYITKKQEFWGRDFLVTPAVLIPRPETEHVIEQTLALEVKPARIIDIGTGSGAIAITLALELEARVVATDISVEAIEVARHNAQTHEARTVFTACDVASAIAPNTFELVVSNPPYVPEPEIDTLQPEVRAFEPRVALSGGETGFDLYRRVIEDAYRVLVPRGRLIMELGFKSAGIVTEMLAADWTDTSITHDLAGIPRVVSTRRRL